MKAADRPSRFLHALRKLKADEAGLLLTVALGLLYLVAILASSCVPAS